MADTLSRFLDAQANGEYAAALGEMQAGRKRSHWIWYVFPQIAGLGQSHMSQTYAIRDRAEAVAYLQHPTLSARLLEVTTAAARQLKSGVPIESLMGSSIDAAKLVSSMTLFSEVAGTLKASENDPHATLARLAEEILAAAATQGYARCRHTVAQLAR